MSSGEIENRKIKSLRGSADYASFLFRKSYHQEACGVDICERRLPSLLYPFQKKLTQWVLRKGKAALWADTGLGKTLMQVSWAAQIPGRVLIVAPLCVSMQTVQEAKKIDVAIGALGGGDKIEITNYERIHQVSASAYDGIVLDESSILKSIDGKTRTRLIEMFRDTRYRLCCTATPAPNDVSELANHCEFLGVMTRAEMLATFFVHDEQNWRLKGHAHEAFYRWLASWGMFVRRPSDLGFSDDGYILPSLDISEHVVGEDAGNFLTMQQDGGIRGRLKARSDSIDDRAQKTADMVRSDKKQWIVWCGLNTEQDALASILGDDCVSVSGSDEIEDKEERLNRFINGNARVLVTKARIAGFGLNLQKCSRMAFCGIGDSFEQYYQAIRRCWRFGQKNKVQVHIVVSEAERGIVENVKRKEREHNETADGLMRVMREAEMEEIGATQKQQVKFEARKESGEEWTAHLGDCVETMTTMPEDSVDLSVYSPPFVSLYTYSASERDMGNSKSKQEFIEHFGYCVRGLLRITKPGRLTCCHVAQIPAQKAKDGFIGLMDLRGPVIEAFVENGWIYQGDVCVDKNPQAQAIRTHAKGLLFAQLKRDSSWLRPGLADFVLVFRKPGDNAVAIHPDISNEDWILWAHPVWYGIRESSTLNASEGRANDDERHICPLQLDLIERCIRLWSNVGETIFSPFMGIGSEGYEAIQLGRKFIGVELKREYFETAVRNLRRANNGKTMALFPAMPADAV